MTTPNWLWLFATVTLLLLPPNAQAQRISTWAHGNDSRPQMGDAGIRHQSVFGVPGGEVARDLVHEMATGPRNGLTLAFGGVVGGALGFIAGGLSGVALCDCKSGGEGYDGIEAFFWGAAAGTAVTIPLGVHTANGLRGSYGTALAASVVISAVGLAAAIRADDDVASPAIVLIIPLSQIVGSVLIERRTTPRAR